MQEIALPSEAGFVVEWQITEDSPVVDLSTAETEVNLAAAGSVGVNLGRGAPL